MRRLSDLPNRFIAFDRAGHRYYLIRRPQTELPGLTRILRQAGLIDASYYTEDSSNRGQAIHRACELYGRARSHSTSALWGELDIESVDPSIRPLVERYRAIIQSERIDILRTECLIGGADLRWATHVDAVVQRTGRRGPLSIKSGSPQPWHSVQLAAEMSALDASIGWLLCLNRSDPRVLPLTGRAFLDALRTFHHALALFIWRREHGDTTCFDDRPLAADFHTGQYASQ